MPIKSSTPLSDQKDVLVRNSNVNAETVAAHEKLEQQLKKLGVEIKPRFNVEPPLGGNRTGCYNRND